MSCDGSLNIFNKITVMDIHMYSNSNQQREQDSIQTPVKKQKIGPLSDLKTAGSPSFSKQTISDIEADQLFTEFNRVVVVSEEEECFEGSETYRKLYFGEELGNKLDFDQSTASMKKKRSAEMKVLEIKPFKIQDENIETQSEIFSPCTPSQKIKSKVGLLSTPTKKITRSAELEKAAKKEDPFRDLKNQGH